MKTKPTLFDRPQATILGLWRELRAWSSPLVNPFLGQSLRQDSRRASWPLALLFVALVWAIVISGHWLAVSRLRVPRDAASDVALVWIGATLVVSWCWKILRDAELLRLEVVKGRMEPIQLAPLSATRRAWLWSAPNSLSAALIGVVALPAIAWGAGGGLLDARDVLGLALWALFLLWGLPNWSPAAWRMQLEKSAPRRKGGNDGFVLPPDLAVNARGWLGGASLLGWLPLLALSRIGIGSNVASSYWDGLPLHVRATGSEIWVNWPLFLARWLLEAQPFFGFALAPVFLIFPLWLAHAHNRVLRLGALTGMERFWTAARIRNWRFAQSVQGVAWLLLLVGVLWPGAIEGAWLAAWFGGARTPDAALAAWWILVLAGGVLASAAMWGGALDNPVGVVSLRAQSGRAARLAARGIIGALALWIGASALGGRWPLGAQWQQIAVPALGVAVVFGLSTFAGETGLRAPRHKAALSVCRFAWTLSVPLLYGIALVFGQISAKTMAHAAYFSPWGLWYLLRDSNVANNPKFWLALGGHVVVAGALGAWSWFVCRDRIAPVALASSEELDEKSPAPIAPALPAVSQIRLTRKSLPAPDAWTKRLLDGLARFDNPLLILETRRVLSASLGIFKADLKRFVWFALFCEALVASVPLFVLPFVGAITRTAMADVYAGVLSVGLLMMVICVLTATSGAGIAYDRDRLDGSLEMLFLTPRTGREIAAGKVGPFVARPILIALLLCPLWLVGLACCPLAEQSLLWAAYLLAPLWMLACAVRFAVASHWMALKKRKIGAGHVGFGVWLFVTLDTIIETCALMFGLFGGARILSAIVFGLCLIYAFQTRWFWKRGCQLLAQWRLHGAPSVK